MIRSSVRVLLLSCLLAPLACDGDDGQITPQGSVLVRTAEAPAGACAHGGTRLATGVDDDGDGVLDDAEVAVTRDVCNLTPDGALKAVSRIEDVGPGEICAKGGRLVRSGLDENGNQALDEDEIVNTDKLCRDETVTRVERLDTLAGCPSGGLSVKAGPDADADGVLDDDEVADTKTSCRDVIPGSVTIKDERDLTLLADVELVGGTVTIQGMLPERATLPRLSRIGDHLIIHFVSGARTLSFPELKQVGGVLSTFSSSPVTLDLPALRRAEQGVQISSNSNLAALDLSQLERVDRVDLLGNGALATLLLPTRSNLRSVTVLDNDQLGTLVLPFSLEHVSVRENDALVTVEGLDALGERGPIRTGTSRLELERNPKLAGLAITPLLFSNVRIDEPGLEALELDLWGCRCDVGVQASVKLTSLKVQGDRFNSLLLRELPFEELSFDFADFGAIYVSGAKLTRIAFPRLERAGNVHLSAPLKSLVFPAEPPRIFGLGLEGSTEIQELLLRELGVRSLNLYRNEALTRVEAGDLIDLIVSNNRELTSLSFSGKTFAEIRVVDNPKLDTVEGFEGVEEVNDLVITGRNAFKRIEMPKLTSVINDVAIEAWEGLEPVDLRALEHAGRVLLSGKAMTVLPRFDALREAQSIFADGTSLTSLAFPSLQTTEWLRLDDNELLTDFSFGQIAELEGAEVKRNKALPTCKVLAFFDAMQIPAGGRVQEGNDDSATCP